MKHPDTITSDHLCARDVEALTRYELEMRTTLRQLTDGSMPLRRACDRFDLLARALSDMAINTSMAMAHADTLQHINHLGEEMRRVDQRYSACLK